MKKIFTIILSLTIIISLFGCKKSDITTTQDETVTFLTTKESPRKYDYLKDSDFDIDKYDIYDIPLIYMEKIYRLKNYKRELTGSTVGKLLITYTQSIDEVFINTDNEKHIITNSKSSLVNVYVDAYFLTDRVKIKEKESDEYKEISYSEYEDKYIVFPFSATIENLELTKESIISIEKIDDNSYKYHMVIDAESSCSTKLKKQMKNVGGLKDYPTFTNIEITLLLNKDFSPIEVNFSSNYTVTKAIIGKINCKQNYTVTYSYYE